MGQILIPLSHPMGQIPFTWTSLVKYFALNLSARCCLHTIWTENLTAYVNPFDYTREVSDEKNFVWCTFKSNTTLRNVTQSGAGILVSSRSSITWYFLFMHFYNAAKEQELLSDWLDDCSTLGKTYILSSSWLTQNPWYTRPKKVSN